MFRADGLNLLFNEKVIYRAIDEIYKVVYQDKEKVIFIYESLDYANYKGYMVVPEEFKPDIEDEEDFKLINRNVLCVDKNGNEIWRIEAPALKDRRADSFLHLSFNEESNEWQGTTNMGHECVVDIETGKLSNIRHFATK